MRRPLVIRYAQDLPRTSCLATTHSTAALCAGHISHVPSCARRFLISKNIIPCLLAARRKQLSTVFYLLVVISNKLVTDQI